MQIKVLFWNVADQLRRRDEATSLNVDALLKLVPQQPSDPCLIACKCQSPATNISAIDVLCSARHMEVFSRLGEYEATCEGIHIDDDIIGSQRLYLLQHTLEEPTPSASFKLVSSGGKEVIHLHSIHITVRHCAPKSGSAMDAVLGSAGFNKIDVDRVSSRLLDMGLEVPQKAQQMMDMMQSQCKIRNEQTSAPPPSIAAMMGMLSAMRPVAPPTATSSPQENPPPAPKSSPEPDGMPDEHADINQRLSAMEQRIVSRLDSQLAVVEQRLSSKIDKIFSLLSEKKNEIALD
ncbi:hypothetical protein CAPTEDRAFT_200522 [Capitella teleta]|uniref:Uncharacterized protein n=1 Tax=Capitella teleta TaxID=283909 RepID=R7U8F0_CAPTE|nr:hypothetical protein CAPTEDRAFT_200522 [Capitella teleta]|eukprot:ELT99956.1 hypothetical protein CAPTEDRAFT_200522 [Capitella teleta]